MRIRIKDFFIYKFLNSLFTGLSVGSVFSIYTPLPQNVYSIGGIILSLGIMIIAKFYEKIMNIRYFFLFSLLVEIVLLMVMAIFLIKPFHYYTALLFYAGYQLAFMFGNYLLRAETIFIKRVKLLSKLDLYKQAGYLSGMFFSFIFYISLEKLFQIKQNQQQVYYLHFFLILLEIMIILSVFRAFRIFR